MQPMRFVGFAQNVGDPMNFKVIECNEDPHKKNIVVHRGVVVQRSTKAIGYNYALTPKSDNYLPDV